MNSIFKKNKNKDITNNLFRYASLGTQISVGLLLLLFLGKKADAYLHLNSTFIWILPALFIVFSLVQIIKETNPRK